MLGSYTTQGVLWSWGFRFRLSLCEASPLSLKLALKQPSNSTLCGSKWGDFLCLCLCYLCHPCSRGSFGLGKPIPPPLLMQHLPLLVGNRIGNRCKINSVYEQSVHFPSTEPTSEATKSPESPELPESMATVGCTARYAPGNAASETKPCKGKQGRAKMLLVVLVLMGQREGLPLGLSSMGPAIDHEGDDTGLALPA